MFKKNTNNQIFFILTILFFLIVAITYDQYVRDQGKVSPLSDFFNFVGLSKLQDWRHSLKTQTKPTSSYIDLTREFHALEDFYLHMKEQRNILGVHRRDFLEQLIDINKEVEKETVRYAALVNQEKMYTRHKSPQLRESFKSAEKAREDLEQLVKTLDYEYVFLSQNIEATEIDLQKTNQQIENRFKELIVKMSELTEGDLIALIDFYFEWRDQQDQLIDNLDQHYQRVREKQEITNRQLKEILLSFKQFSEIDFNPLDNLANQGMVRRQAIWDQLLANENQLFQLFHQIRMENENFIYRIADSMKIDLDRFLEKLQQEAQIQARWVQAQEKLHRRPENERRPTVPAIDPQQLKAQQRQQQEALREKMDQMRDKSR